MRPYRLSKKAPLILILAFTGAGLPGLLAAQTCLGAPMIAGRIVNVEGTAGFYEAGSRLGLGVTVGSRLFFSADYDRENHDQYGQPQDTFGAILGYELLDGGRRFGICPTASVSHSDGIIDHKVARVAAGMGVGFRGHVSESVSIVPFGNLWVVRSRLVYDAGEAPDPEPRWGGLLVLGLRVGGARYALGPVAHIPIGADEGEAFFGTGIGISLLLGL